VSRRDNKKNSRVKRMKMKAAIENLIGIFAAKKGERRKKTTDKKTPIFGGFRRYGERNRKRKRGIKR